MSIKEALKKIPGLYTAAKYLRYGIKDLGAIPQYMAERRIKRNNGPIRVGFFCQYIPAWAKMAPIYERMKEDARFEPYLLALPSGITNCQLNEPESLENDTYEYLRRQGYTEAINTLLDIEQWLDMEALDLSYVFYPRPYNPLVPACYHSGKVSRYSKVCIIMYGMTTTEQTSSITLNQDFMRHAYFYFAETAFAKRVNIKKNWLLHKLGLQKTLCIGYPVLEQLANMKNVQSPSWNFAKSDFRILWTPRWSTDKNVGGSNFFTYKDFFLDSAQQWSDIDILMRPHPLMFSNFLKTGEMSQQEIDAFIEKIDALPNVKLDDQSQYEATLWGSDVLVTDLSGIVPEYFTTGKPVVFCMTNMELKLADYFDEMVKKGCYVVNSEEELRNCLDALQRGEDSLVEVRKQLIPQLFGTAGDDATQHIVEEIAKDARNRKMK